MDSSQAVWAKHCQMWHVLVLVTVATACSLCPLRVPPRPRPLDQYKLPSIPHLNLESMPEFCRKIRNALISHRKLRRGRFPRFQAISPVNSMWTSRVESASRSCSATPTTLWPLVYVHEGSAKHSMHDESAFPFRLLDQKEAEHGTEGLKRAKTGIRNTETEIPHISGWDSLGKPAAGVSDGNYYWLGDYELCTLLRSEGKFDGQYCRVELEIPDALVEEGCPQTDPLAIVLGVCMPSSCTNEQLHKLIQGEVQVYFPSSNGYQGNDIHDVYCISEYSPYKSEIDCELDVRLSTAALVMLAPQSLHALHGLEFITFIWLVTAMVYNLMLPYIENVAFSYDAVSSVTAHLTNNYSYLVDGLLALSALYTTYLLFWPAYIFCVLFMWILFPELSAGPLWIHTDTVERCSSSWWKNILFINNFFGVKDTVCSSLYKIFVSDMVLLLVKRWHFCSQS
ncbi:unnamed protein product [Heligmosomoides polygyrus]|uniref:NRF domain-containing protein n=1 Tax=Heligmosomoides polygyrus TaxID=6339 RepID=A0A3P7XL11_HELPZ|nr:unnamed protein product [Heligmosomoides polygyrus]